MRRQQGERSGWGSLAATRTSESAIANAPQGRLPCDADQTCVDLPNDLRDHPRVRIRSCAFRDAVRVVGRSPLLVASVVGTLAFAIAGVVTVLALMNAVVLRPLPFPHARELYTVEAYSAAGQRQGLSFPTFADWQERTTSFETLTALTVADFNVLGGDHAESILAALVSSEFFETLGVWPARGRTFAEGDYVPGSERAVILSHSFWQRRFGGDAAILGQTIRLAGPEYLHGSDGSYTVIGVMPDSFWLFWKRSDVLVPLRASAKQMSERRTAFIDQVLGRLRPNASLEDARLELTALNATLERAFGRESVPASFRLKPTQEAHFADVRPVLWLVGLAGAMVLVLAAINVTTMLLAHGISREREFAVRLALGATRVHLAIQGAAEGLVLALFGGAGGVLLGVAATGVVRSLIPRANLARIPGEADAITVDATVMGAVVGIVVVFASILGTACVTAAFSHRIFCSLRQGLATTATPARLRLRSTLVGVQLALSMALVLTSWVLLHNLTRLASVDLGVRSDGLVTAWVNLSPSRFPDPESRSQFYDRVMERVRGVPRVMTLGAVDFPFKYDWQPRQYSRSSFSEQMRRISHARSGGPRAKSTFELRAFRYSRVARSYRPTPLGRHQ